MDGFIGFLILLGLITYVQSRAAARRHAPTRSRSEPKAPRQRNAGGKPQASRRTRPPGRGPNIISDILKGNRGSQPPAQPHRDDPAAGPTTTAPAERGVAARLSPDRPETAAAAGAAELQAAGRLPGLTFEEEARALEAAYSQLGNVFDEAIDQLTAHLTADATTPLPPGETARQVKPAQPLVTTDLQEIKQGIILANVLERPKIRQAPAAIRRKGV